VKDSLTPDELKRYSRHMILGEIGEDGQRRLKQAGVLLVGAGGLGAPAALYLAAAGVGRLGLVDDDAVDVTNLQRQVIFGTSDAGRPKPAAARDRLRDLNPGIAVVTHETRLTGDNAMEVISGYDIVVDGSDNFAAKYLINDACILMGKPDVYGSVLRFEGQAAVFGAAGGPCYRCLYPEPPPPGAVLSCADAGVLGVLPGIVGSIQAAETIKLIVGCGETLAGRLLLLDSLSMTFREVEVPKNPDCPVCGENPTITELVDYEEFCGAGGPAAAADVPELTPAELKARMDAGEKIVLLDVREPYERRICDIGGLLLPMARVPSMVGDLDPKADVVVYCRVGIRSAYVVRYLLDRGFTRVWNLRGGIHAWTDQVDPSLPKY
jgi:molybdopterin/thiamine biosynthesis adenylyltransferase/rhodanese-related sulfurtransferase